MAKITKEEKERIVGTMAERVSRAKAIIFTDYRGLTVAEMEKLRHGLAEHEAEYQVIKHTLFRRALEKSEGVKIALEEIESHPLAVAWGYEDEISLAKTVYNFGKEHEALEILGGVIDGEMVAASDIKNLALLPTREELLGKLVGSLNAPVANFVGVLRAVLTNTVYVFSAIKEAKG